MLGLQAMPGRWVMHRSGDHEHVIARVSKTVPRSWMIGWCLPMTTFGPGLACPMPLLRCGQLVTTPSSCTGCLATLATGIF
jgi:hypothetical protein